MKRPKRKTLAHKQAESAAAGVIIVNRNGTKYTPKPRYTPEPVHKPSPPTAFDNRPFARALRNIV